MDRRRETGERRTEDAVVTPTEPQLFLVMMMLMGGVVKGKKLR